MRSCALSLLLVMGLAPLMATVPPVLALTPGWGPVVAVESSTDCTRNPDVAVFGTGSAIAVWEQQENGCPDPWLNPVTYGVWANRFEAASGWGVPERIEFLTGNSTSPRVVASSSGEAFAVWNGGGGGGVWTNRYAPGIGWTGARVLDSGNATSPDISAGTGGAFAVWSKWNGVDYSLNASRYVPFVGWTSAETLSTGRFEFFASVAVDGRGDAMVIWTQWVSGQFPNVFAKRYVQGSGWASAEDIDAGGDAFATDLAADRGGNVTAVWFEGDLRARYYFTGMGWGTPQRIGPGIAVQPRVAMSEAGSATVVWGKDTGARFGIYAARYVRASGWGREQAIDVAGLGNSWKPQVAMDKSGNAVAIWQQSDGFLDHILANWYRVGESWGEPEFVETYNAGPADRPAVGIDSAGNAIAVWQHTDGRVMSILGSRYLAPDTTPPWLVITSPVDGFRTNESLVMVSGRTEAGSDLIVNGLRAAVYANGTFSVNVPLRPGSNVITITAIDPVGNRVEVSVAGVYDQTPNEDALGRLREEVAGLAVRFTVLSLGVAALVVAVASFEVVRYFRKRRRSIPAPSTNEPTGDDRPR